MSSSLPEEIRVTDLSGGGVCYRLPMHRRGCGTVLGLFFTLFGVFIILGAAAFLAAAIIISRSVFLVLVIWCVCLPFLALGLFLFLSGTWLAFGHTEVRLASGQLTSVLKIGPLPFVIRRRSLTVVHRLAVISDSEQNSPMLVAACGDAQPLELAGLYPYNILWNLGNYLAERCNAARGEETKQLEIEEEWSDFTGERPAQPVLSRIAVEEAENSLVFRIPPAGWRSLGVVVLVMLAAVFAAVALVFAVTSVLDGRMRLLIPGLVFGIAVGLLLGAVEVARRRVVIEVRDDILTLNRVGLRTRTQTWDQGELEAIRVVREQRKRVTHDEGGKHTHWEWVTELQIHPEEGRPVILTGRYGMHGQAVAQEWEWLGTRLREALDVPA